MSLLHLAPSNTEDDISIFVIGKCHSAMFQNLPRDVRICIAKKMNIDARMKVRLPPGKLKLPIELIARLSDIQLPAHYSIFSMVCILKNIPSKYTERF